LKEETQKERNTFVASHESENELNNKENWRGQGKTNANKRKSNANNGKSRKKLKYLDACADWDLLLNGTAIGISPPTYIPIFSKGLPRPYLGSICHCYWHSGDISIY